MALGGKRQGSEQAQQFLHLPLPANLTPHATETLQGLTSDRIRAEQYLDFVRNRTFRWTLLCHDRVPVQSPSAQPAAN